MFQTGFESESGKGLGAPPPHPSKVNKKLRTKAGVNCEQYFAWLQCCPGHTRSDGIHDRTLRQNP